ncbi:MAG: phage tail family protein [Dehalococcoidia bacterium]|nr:phage tail family protein [Dehalococcoidia bacterium]
MANSFTYRGYDFSAYGLVVKDRDIPMTHEVDSLQLHYKAFATDSKIPPKTISLSVAVTAADVTTLKTNLDTIKRLLNTQVDENLILDSLSDRYWIARFQRLAGKFKGVMFEGNVDFLCLDPYAYGNSLISHDYAIAISPQTITETPGGTALIEPVFLLTSSAIATATRKVENHSLSMEISWGPLAMGVGGILSIDSSLWHVTLNGVASMATVTGQFPVLSPGEANSIIVTGLTGNLNITYRNKFA